MSISSPRDFRYGEGEEVDAGVILSDPRYSLYCLDTRAAQAVFVEVNQYAALTDGPFYYQAQYRLAQAAVFMPYSSMHDLADAMGDQFQQVVMLHSVGRCGSTLLAKMFHQVPECMSVSEPDAYPQLMSTNIAPQSVGPLLRSATRLFRPPTADSRPSHLVLKHRSFCVELAAAMHRVIPNSVELFLYRDADSVIRSSIQSFLVRGSALWWADQLHRWRVTRPVLSWIIKKSRGDSERIFPAIARFSDRELARFGVVGLLAIAWLSAMERCVLLQRAGLSILPIQYPDLVGPNRERALANILDHCRLPTHRTDQMVAALASDAQANSVLARKHKRDVELTQRDHATIREVLKRSELVNAVDFQIEEARSYPVANRPSSVAAARSGVLHP